MARRGYSCLNAYTEGCKTYSSVSSSGRGAEGEFKVAAGLWERRLAVRICWAAEACTGAYECVDGSASEVGIMGMVADEEGGRGRVDFD